MGKDRWTKLDLKWPKIRLQDRVVSLKELGAIRLLGWIYHYSFILKTYTKDEELINLFYYMVILLSECRCGHFPLPKWQKNYWNIACLWLDQKKKNYMNKNIFRLIWYCLLLIFVKDMLPTYCFAYVC